MTQKEKLLAAEMLKAASEEFGNHCSNDWEFPADWTTEEKTQFVRDYHEWNGDPEEFRADHVYLPDFGVMAFLAYKLKL